MKTKELTKEWLQDHNISVEGTDIYYDGKRGFKKLTPYVITGPSKMGKPKKYLGVMVYLKETQKQKMLLVHRVIYAWYKGIAHEDLTIDHKDNDPFNNNIENLREISLKDNLKSRVGNGHNNYLYYGMYGMTDKEVDRLKDLTLRIGEMKANNGKISKEQRDSIDELKNKLIDLKKDYYNSRNNLIDNYEGNAYYSLEFKFARAEYVIKRDTLKKQLKMAQDNFHNRVKDLKEIQEDYKLLRSLYKERVNKKDKELNDINYAIEQVYTCLSK